VVDVYTGGVPEAQVAPLLSEHAVATRFEIGGDGEVVESCPELARMVTLSCSSGLAEGISARAGLADADLPIFRVYVLTDGTPTAENRVRTQAANLVPNAIIHTQQDRLDVDALYLSNLGQLLRVGWPFVLLRASGLRLGELRQVVFLETAAAMLVTAAVGVGLGMASSYALALFGDMAWTWPDVGVFAMVGIGVLAALIRPGRREAARPRPGACSSPSRSARTAGRMGIHRLTQPRPRAARSWLGLRMCWLGLPTVGRLTPVS
jgi:hypothetical protein